MQTGREQWKFETEGSLSSPTIVNEIVYFSSYKTLCLGYTGYQFRLVQS